MQFRILSIPTVLTSSIHSSRRYMASYKLKVSISVKHPHPTSPPSLRSPQCPMHGLMIDGILPITYTYSTLHCPLDESEPSILPSSHPPPSVAFITILLMLNSFFPSSFFHHLWSQQNGYEAKSTKTIGAIALFIQGHMPEALSSL